MGISPFCAACHIQYIVDYSHIARDMLLWLIKFSFLFCLHGALFITLRAKLNGAVYCNQSCLWVGVFVGLLPR